MPDTYAKPVSVVRDRVVRAPAEDKVKLRELFDVAGFWVFRCDRLHAELSPTACAKNYQSPRYEACVSCPIGKRHQRESNLESPTRHGRSRRSSVDAPRCAADVDVNAQLARRAALLESNGNATSFSCIRCSKSAMTNQRLIGRMRLVRQTICVSCYNRERELVVGMNAKGARPKKWNGKLFEIRLVCVEAGRRKRIEIGLGTGVEEARRYAARVYPMARVIGISVADEFHLIAQPYAEVSDHSIRA